MKALALRVAAISVLLGGSASAADMRLPAPVQAPPLAPVAVSSWTGCYVGAGGGYGLWNQRSQFINDGTVEGLPNDNGGRGYFGTVQAGCDYQAGSSFVIGAFADYDFNGLKGDMAVPVRTAVGEEKLQSSWAVGGRIGWLVSPQLLVFASAGYTQARFGQVTFTDIGGAVPLPADNALSRHTYSGWFLGSGYEYGIGWLPGLFWKTEYRMADYSADRVAIVSTITGDPTGDSLDLRKRVHTVRSELVWRFGASGAAAAYAADLRGAGPLKAPPAPVPVTAWTGCYAGAGAGYGMWAQKSLYLTGGANYLPNDNGGRGWFGTVQAGCDYQVSPNIIIGASADYDFSGIRGDMSVVPQLWVGNEKLQSSWAAGGRIGWLPFQRLLTFVSAGYTQARFARVDFLSATNGLPIDVFLPQHTYSGWYLGTGYEYGIGWLPNLFWKTEYRYADYGSDNVALYSSLTGAPRGFDSLDLHKRIHTVRSEVVWRFNWGNAVAARF